MVLSKCRGGMGWSDGEWCRTRLYYAASKRLVLRLVGRSGLAEVRPPPGRFIVNRGVVCRAKP